MFFRTFPGRRARTAMARNGPNAWVRCMPGRCPTIAVSAAALPLALNCHFHVAETAKQAADEFFPAYSLTMNRIGRERGWPPMSRAQFDHLCGPQGPLFVGSVQDIIDKLLYLDQLFGNSRFLGQMMLEGMPHEQVRRSVELFGREVAPAVREALGVQPLATAAVG